MKLGDGLSLDECKTACVTSRETYGFYCAAILMRTPACFLTGYHLKNNYWSTHFTRTCKIGMLYLLS